MKCPGGPRSAPPRSVRHREARRAGAAARARRDGAAVRDDVAVLKITVAALMTTAWIARILEVPPRHRSRADPRPCEGDPQSSAERFGVPRREGPEGPARDPPLLRPARLPRRTTARWDIEILAEINNAPRLTPRRDPRGGRLLPRHRRRRHRHRLHARARLSRARRRRPRARRRRHARQRRHLRPGRDPHGGRRPAPSSCSASTARNIDVARDLAGTRRARGRDAGPRRRARHARAAASSSSTRWGVGYLIDPILEPIGFGFMASLERYAEVRRRYPDARDADGHRQHHRAHGGRLHRRERAADRRSARSSACARCSRPRSSRGRAGAVREIDIARRLMHYAVTSSAVPKGDRRPARHRQGPGVLELRRRRAARAAGRGHRSQLPHLRRPRRRSPCSTTSSSSAAPTSRRSSRSSASTRRPTRSISARSWRRRSSPSRSARPTARRARSRWGYLTPPDDAKSEHVQADAALAKAARSGRPGPMSDGCDAAGGGAGPDGATRSSACARFSTCRTGCSSTAHGDPPASSSSAATPFSPPIPRASSAARAAAPRLDRARTSSGRRSSRDRARRRARRCSRPTPPSRCRGCRRSRAARPAISATTGARARASARAPLRRPGACPTWCSVSTTG